MKIKALVVKACHFVGSSRKDLAGFPEEVRGDVGHALHEAQCGLEPYSAKALKGFGGRGILEAVETTTETPLEPFTRYVLLMRSTFFIVFKRNQGRELRRRNTRSS